ncbi:MAG: WxcM-like domain-containing protein [Ginsengibacter sp.]
MNKKPQIIRGGDHEDERGKIIFCNEFDLSEVKRFYLIEHRNIDIVRAWQGHQREQKWFFVVEGAFKIVLVQPDNWENPSNTLSAEAFILKSSDVMILHVPGNYANGFKALEPKSKIMVFSSFTVEESSKDNFRFDKERWYNWNEN